MAEWPKRYRAPQDILGGEADDGIPVIRADLGRELYLALKVSMRDNEYGIRTGDGRQLRDALARYEREVDTRPARDSAPYDEGGPL